MGRIIAYLFFGVFAAAGIAAFYFSGFGMVTKNIKARSWEPIYAQLQSYDLDTSRSDDTTTYKVTASYTYEYLGVNYE